MRVSGVGLLLVVLAGPVVAAAQPLQVVHEFEAPPASPLGGLVQAADGSLYGTTSQGGVGGTIYRIPPGGGALTVVANFDRGRFPGTALVRGAGGALYGTTTGGGVNDLGTVFRFDPVAGRIQTLHAFTGFGEGSTPESPVLIAADGRLYGMTTGTLYRIDPDTGRIEILLAFPRFGPLGDTPAGALVQTADGMLWAEMRGGGPGDSGTIIRVDPATAAATVVHAFVRPDGWDPFGGLRLTSDGWLYGSTLRGGDEDAGTIFRIDPATGAFESVYSLRPSNGTDAQGPFSRLAEGPDGALYGTTSHILDLAGHSIATVFRLRRLPGGGHAFATIVNVDAATAGQGLLADLVVTSDGWAYGAAEGAGPLGGGTVFRFDTLERGAPGNALQFSVVHAFTTGGPGWFPAAPPVPGSDGLLYGLTRTGGANGNGDVYRLDPGTGSTTVLAPVPGPARLVGSYPVAFIDGGDGNLYVPVQNDDDAHILRLVPATGAVTTVLSFPATDRRFVGGFVRAGSSIYALVSATGGLRLDRFDPVAGTLTAGPIVPTGTSSVSPPAGTHDGYVLYQTQTLVITGPFLGNFRWDLQTYRVDPATGVPLLIDLEMHHDSFVLTTPVEAPTGAIYYAGHTDTFGSRVLAYDPASGGRGEVCVGVVPVGAVSSLSALPDGHVLAAFDVWSSTAGPAHSELYRCAIGVVATRIDPGAAVPGGVSWFAPGPGGLFYAAGGAGRRGGGTIVRLNPDGPTPLVDGDGDGLDDEWERFFGFDPASATGADGPSGDPDGDGIPNVTEQAEGTHPRGTATRYLAEGANNAFFHTTVAIANPSLDPATVVVRFLTDAGAVVRQALVVPARSRGTLDAAAIPGLESASFATIVEADRPIAVDRTMSWDGRGYGSHTEAAVAAPSTTWSFAEGSTSGAFQLFYLFENPQAVPVRTTVRYLRPGGLPPIEHIFTLGPHTRTTVEVEGVAPELRDTDLGATITAAAPIIVERAMYRSSPDRIFSAGHDSAGVTAPALEWFLAEGATGAFFDTFVLIANPSPTAAQVTAEYLLIGGGALTKNYVVPAEGRLTIYVDAEELPAGSGQHPLADTALSTTIRSTNGVPVVVERTMWWPGPAMTADFWYEAHNSPGATATATRWVAPGGEVGGSDGAETYILIANTTATPGRVLVRLLFENGNTTGRYYDLPPKSRTNVPLGQDFPEAVSNRRAAVVVESVGAAPVPVVVERATYASPEGVLWASGGNTLAAPMP